MNYRFCDEWGYRRLAPTRMGLRVVSEPAGEQITVAEARLHCRLDAYGSPAAHPDDDILADLIVAAREYCENDLGRAIVPQTFELTMSGFPAMTRYGAGEEIEIPMPPVASVESVIYLDSAAASTTMPVPYYRVDVSSEPGVLYVLAGASWPSALAGPNAVKVRYQAGYTLPNSSPNNMPCPKSIKRAMLLIVGHLYENREQTNALDLKEIPLAASSLMDRWRIRTGIA